MRAGAKERAGREKSSAATTHADAFFFFAGLAPARAASLELRFPLGRREQVATPVSREAFGAKEEASSFPRGSARNALKMSSSGDEVIFFLSCSPHFLLQPLRLLIRIDEPKSAREPPRKQIHALQRSQPLHWSFPET